MEMNKGLHISIEFIDGTSTNYNVKTWNRNEGYFALFYGDSMTIVPDSAVKTITVTETELL